jgi:hypothetical protein
MSTNNFISAMKIKMFADSAVRAGISRYDQVLSVDLCNVEICIMINRDCATFSKHWCQNNIWIEP